MSKPPTAGDGSPFNVDADVDKGIVDRVQFSIRDAIRQHELIRESYNDWPSAGSELKALSDALPHGPLVLSGCLADTAAIARMSLETIERWLTTGETNAGGVYGVPLAIQMRTALMAAGRVLYCVGPESVDERRQHGEQVLHQQAVSLLRAVKAFGDFQELNRLVPPAEFTARVRSQVRALADRTGHERPMGEEWLITIHGVVGV